MVSAGLCDDGAVAVVSRMGQKPASTRTL
jgi:hypothetical protein